MQCRRSEGTYRSIVLLDVIIAERCEGEEYASAIYVSFQQDSGCGIPRDSLGDFSLTRSRTSAQQYY